VLDIPVFPNLLQAALAVLSATPSQPHLSRFYIHTVRTIGKRLVLRMWGQSHWPCL